jgi:hypothetical protein
MVNSKKKSFSSSESKKSLKKKGKTMQMGGNIDLETFEINPNIMIDYDSIKVAKHVNVKWPKDDVLWPGPPPTDCTIL